MKTLRERFEAKYIPEPNSGCWLWTASVGTHGYGQIAIRTGIPQTAHRVSYELHCGPVPKNLHVLHHCDNRACVNPGHLYLGTEADNIRDAYRRGRRDQPRGSSHARAKLSDDQVRAIRSDSRSWWEIAQSGEYPVSKRALRQAKDGETWRHV